MFVESMEALERGVLTMKGVATIGTVEVKIDGITRSSGDDTENRTTMTVAGKTSVTTTIKVEGDRFERKGTGPWFEKPSSGGEGDVSLQLRDVVSAGLTDRGVVQFEGKPAHRLVPSAGGFDPAALLDIEGATNVRAQLEFYAAADGTPLGATIEVTWRQPSGDSTVDGEMSVTVEFSDLGVPQTIRRPDDVWEKFWSQPYGYIMGYPADWEFNATNEGWDEFDPPTAYAWVLVASTDAEGGTTNQWARAELAQRKAEFKAKSGNNVGYVLDGVVARFLTLSGKDADGVQVNLYEVVVVKGDRAYIVGCVTELGRNGIPKALFEQMLATFEFA